MLTLCPFCQKHRMRKALCWRCFKWIRDFVRKSTPGLQPLSPLRLLMETELIMLMAEPRMNAKIIGFGDQR